MKVITLLFSLMLCGSVFAADATPTLSAVLVQFREKAENARVYAKVANDRKGTLTSYNDKLSDMIEQMADPSADKHSLAWGASRDEKLATKPLTELRKAVAALPPSAEVKTFLSRALDPSLAAIAAYKTNDAEISRTQVEALAQLHAVIDQAK